MRLFAYDGMPMSLVKARFGVAADGLCSGFQGFRRQVQAGRRDCEVAALRSEGRNNVTVQTNGCTCEHLTVDVTAISLLRETEYLLYDKHINKSVHLVWLLQ